VSDDAVEPATGTPGAGAGLEWLPYAPWWNPIAFGVIAFVLAVPGLPTRRGP